MKQPRIKQPIHPDLISREQAAVLLGMSAAYVAKLQLFHEYRIAPKCIRLDREEVEAYLAARSSASGE
jgi:hypothetical protein